MLQMRLSIVSSDVYSDGYLNQTGPGFCDRAQKQCRPQPAITEGQKRSAVFYQVTGVHLMCQMFMNDLLTEQGQQRSRVIR